MTHSRLWRQYFTVVAAALPPARGILPLVVLLGAWQLLQTGNSPYFPPPSDWCNGLVLLEKSGRLYPALLATTMTMLLGLAVAVVIGGELVCSLAYHRGLAAPSDRFSNF